MIQCIIDKTIRLEKVTNNTFLTAPLVSGNSLAHMVRLRVLDSDGEPADLTGISATGAFNRPDGHQVTPINVTITGNVVECVFPASCYTTAGRFRFMLDLNETVNNETALRTAFVLDGLIEIGPTGSVVDPGTPVPNIQAAIANAQLATTAANTAAQTATTAAAAAQDVADNVEGEVSALKSAVFEYVTMDTGIWEQGTISASSGGNSNSDNVIRTKGKIPIDFFRAYTLTGYELNVYGWSGSTYLGYYDGTEYKKTGTALDYYATERLASDLIAAGANSIRMTMRKTGGGVAIDPSECVNVMMAYSRVSVLESEGDDLKATIASRYDSEKTYNAGEYCLFDNQLYRCLCDKSPGEFVKTDWLLTEIGLEMAAAQNGLVNFLSPGTDGEIIGSYGTSISGVASGNRLVLNGETASSSTPITFIMLGTKIRANSNATPSFPKELQLLDRHTYLASMKYISGTVATGAVYCRWYIGNTNTSIGTYTSTGTPDSFGLVTYDKSLYPDGIFPAIKVSRPSGITLTNYTVELTIRDVTLEQEVAPVEGTIALSNHAIDDIFWLDGILYKATAAIAAGEAITLGTNVTETTVMAELSALKALIANN